MPRHQKAMKDVAGCDKLRGAAKQALIRRFPNAETRQGNPLSVLSNQDSTPAELKHLSRRRKRK
jgi:hypothetical protein